MAARLIEKMGADVRATLNDGSTAVHLAAHEAEMAMVMTVVVTAMVLMLMVMMTMGFRGEN